MADYSAAERRQLASDGKALPDGSFPIVTRQDLENAIHLIGQAHDRHAAVAHIIQRAHALGLASMLPQNWPR